MRFGKKNEMMNQKFQANLQQRDDLIYLRLGGVIDEDNELFDLLERIEEGTAIIDLAAIERINSCGVRDWLSWLSRLERKVTEVIFVECSPAVVAHLNLVDRFIGNGRVQSFYAPYFCARCDLERVWLVELSEMQKQNVPKAPVCRCDVCGHEMEFDDLEDSYFAFVHAVSATRISGALSEALAQMGNTPPHGGKIRARGDERAGFAHTTVGPDDSAADPSERDAVAVTGPTGARLSYGSASDAQTPDRETATVTRQSAAKTEAGSRTTLALILVIILAAAAIGLLLYVIWSKEGATKESNEAQPQPQPHSQPSSQRSTSFRSRGVEV
jgi:anti-anti-sigma regulatory factor